MKLKPKAPTNKNLKKSSHYPMEGGLTGGVSPIFFPIVYQSKKGGKKTIIVPIFQSFFKGEPFSAHSINLLLLMVVTCMFMSCVSPNQVLNYQTPIYTYNNVIPGIEPEEGIQKIKISVEGKGISPRFGTEPEKKILAERAAVMDAYRNLAERIGGFIINAYTASGNNNISRDQVMVETKAYMRGARITMVKYEKGIAIAFARVYLEPRRNRFFNNPGNINSIFGLFPSAISGPPSHTAPVYSNNLTTGNSFQ